MKTGQNRRRFLATGLDRLETREVLSHVVIPHTHVAQPFHLRPASANLVVANPKVTTPVKVASPSVGQPPTVTGSGSMQKLGNDLAALYQAYLTSPADTSTLQTKFPRMQFSGSKVLVSLQTRADVNIYAGELTNLGMDVTGKSAQYGWVTGYFPINQLSTLASMPDTLSGQAQYKPVIGGFFH